MSSDLMGKISAAKVGLIDTQVDRLERGMEKSKDKAALKKSATDFESIFVGMMLKSMRNSVQKSGFLDGGNAEDIYRSMLDQEYSKVLSGTNKLGLANTIERQLSRAAGWETSEINQQARSSHLEKAKALRAYSGEGLKSDEKRVTIEVAKK